MQTLTGIVTLLVAISVAVERVTDLLKKMFHRYFLDSDELPLSNEAAHRQAQLIALSVAVGTLIAALAQEQLKAVLRPNLANHTGWVMYVIVGLMASGGSEFWKNVLAIILELQLKKKWQMMAERAEARARIAMAEAQIAGAEELKRQATLGR